MHVKVALSFSDIIFGGGGTTFAFFASGASAAGAAELLLAAPAFVAGVASAGRAVCHKSCPMNP